jgi:2'-5' RNA ligase
MQLPMFEAEAVARVSYMVIISPPPSVAKAVAGLKKRLHEEIGLDGMNLRARAHISLCRFEGAERDQWVINTITRAVGHLYCFEIRLNGADVFLHGKSAFTLYIKIEQPEPVRRISAAIAWLANGRETGLNTPHLTIAKSVPVKKLPGIVPSAYDYYHDFICSHITILKRAGEKYAVIHEAPLQPLPGAPG